MVKLLSTGFITVKIKTGKKFIFVEFEKVRTFYPLFVIIRTTERISFLIEIFIDEDTIIFEKVKKVK